MVNGYSQTIIADLLKRETTLQTESFFSCIQNFSEICATLKGLNLPPSLKAGHNEKGSKNFNV